MIKAIIYDCFGVLASDPWQEFLQGLDEYTRIQVQDLHKSYDKGLISYQDFVNGSIETSSDISSEDLSNIFITHKGNIKNHLLLSDIGELKKGYKIGMLSNAGTDWVRREFLTAQELALFDDIVLSYEVGVGKPDQQIFKLACARLGVECHEAVLVDDIGYYCQAAELTGMKTVHYKNIKSYSNDLRDLLSGPDN